MDAKEHLECLQRLVSAQNKALKAFLNETEQAASVYFQEGFSDEETDKI